MFDRTNHNALAEQFAARFRADYVEARVSEIAAFEARARGQAPRKSKRSTQPNPPATTPTAAAQAAIEGVTPMSLFQPAESTTAHLKAGFMGKQGSGKSVTASLFAIGLVRYLKEQGIGYANKPVAFFDTETGSDWMIPLFKEVGIPLVVAKKRSFADLVAAVKWAEEHASALIIDSITHPWRELQESYLKKKQRSFLQIDDWSYLKGPQGWAQFTDLYINSKLHILMCGRAGDDTEQYTDENGKRQFEKVGIKMKTETETGFEPSLLVLMEREMDLRTKKTSHKASIVKDRSMLLDGKDFTFHGYDEQGGKLPTDVLVRQVWAAFSPHVQQMNVGGKHVGVDASGDSTAMIKTEKRDWTPVQREICVDEIQTLLALHYPSQTADDKKSRLKALLAHFDATWTEIEKVMPLPDLRAGYDSLHQALEGKPSKYAGQIEAPVIERQVMKVEAISLEDGLPDHSAPPKVDTTTIAPNGMPEFLVRQTSNDASPQLAATGG